MKIAHFSDVHVGMDCPDISAWFDKRFVGLFNYKFRRCHKHDLSLLDKAIDYILENDFDVIVCTGDLTTTGQAHEFELAKKHLQRLVDSKIPILYSPGNHDAYVKRKSCVNALSDMINFLSHGEYSLDTMPLVKNIKGVDFLLYNCSYPSNLLCSWGVMKKATRNKIIEICNEEKKFPRISINHYPLTEEHPILRLRHGLLYANKVKELLKTGDIDLSLCGHIHRQFTHTDATGRGEYCTGSVTANGLISEIYYDKESNNFDFKIINLKDDIMKVE